MAGEEPLKPAKTTSGPAKRIFKGGNSMQNRIVYKSYHLTSSPNFIVLHVKYFFRRTYVYIKGHP